LLDRQFFRILVLSLIRFLKTDEVLFFIFANNET